MPSILINFEKPNTFTMNHFLSSKNTVTVAVLWTLVVFLLTMIGFALKENQIELVPLLIITLVCALIIWILLDTRYVIRNRNLYYRSGPFRGRISIEKIIKIQYFSGLNNPTTFKPALDFKGYILTYNKFNTVYVSPKKAKIFIEELLKINPKIECI